jgi:hypothetical protein
VAPLLFHLYCSINLIKQMGIHIIHGGMHFCKAYMQEERKTRTGEHGNEVTRLWRPPQDLSTFFRQRSSLFGTAIRVLSFFRGALAYLVIT